MEEASEVIKNAFKKVGKRMFTFLLPMIAMSVLIIVLLSSFTYFLFIDDGIWDDNENSPAAFTSHASASGRNGITVDSNQELDEYLKNRGFKDNQIADMNYAQKMYLLGVIDENTKNSALEEVFGSVYTDETIKNATDDQKNELKENVDNKILNKVLVDNGYNENTIKNWSKKKKSQYIELLEMGTPKEEVDKMSDEDIKKKAPLNAGADLYISARIVWYANDVYKKYLSTVTELEKMMNAELITQYPKIDSDSIEGLSGVVKFMRTSKSSGSKELKYMDEATFDSKVASSDSDVLNYFKMDDDANVTVATWKRVEVGIEGGLDAEEDPGTNIPGPEYTISTTKVNYKAAVSSYTMPFNYLWAMLCISEDKDFVMDLADLVYSSDIRMSLFDKITINTETTTYTSNKQITVSADIDFDKISSIAYKNEGEIEQHKREIIVTTTTDTIEQHLTYANVWVAVYTHNYQFGTSNSSSGNTVPYDEVRKDEPFNLGNAPQEVIDYANAYISNNPIEVEEEVPDEESEDGGTKKETHIEYAKILGIDGNKVTRWYDRKDEIKTDTQSDTLKETAAQKAEPKISKEGNSSNTSANGTGFWWPIGSAETTTENGKLFASGEPELGKESISRMGATGVAYGITRPAHGGNLAIDVGAGQLSNHYNVISIGKGKVTAMGDGVPNGYRDENANGGMGNYVWIEYDGGIVARFMHLYPGSIQVNVGDEVTYGQVIGKVGHNGDSTGPHMHMDIKQNGASVDATEFVDPDNPRPTAEGTGSTGFGNGDISSLSKVLFIGDSYIAGLQGSGAISGAQFKGISGSTPQQWNSGYLSGLPTNVDAVCVYLGTNGPSQTSDMEQVIDKLVSQFSGKPIYINQIMHMGKNYWSGNPDAMNTSLDKFNAAIKEKCDKTENVYYIDTSQGLVEGGYLAHPDGQGIHFGNIDDYKTWAQNIANAMQNPGGTSSGNTTQSGGDNFITLLMKHEKARANIFSVPSWLFEILEKNEDTANMVDLTKFLLNSFLEQNYFGEIKWEDLEEMFYPGTTSVGTTGGLVGLEWMKSFENGTLRQYMLGKIPYSSYVARFVSEDRTTYYSYPGAGVMAEAADCQNFSYGIMWRNAGAYYHEAEFAEHGVALSSLGGTGAPCAVDVVDAVMESIWMGKQDAIASFLSGKGIALEQHQLDCLTDMDYQGWWAIRTESFVAAYNQGADSAAMQAWVLHASGSGVDGDARAQARWNLWKNGEYKTSDGEILDAANYGGSASGSSIVARAQGELGKPYVWGAVGPASYDCSGLVSYAVTGEYTRLGTTYTFMGWQQVDPSEAKPGDIVTSSSHCGIYIGEGNMIHAPCSGDVVKIGPVQAGMIYVKVPEQYTK